MRSLTIYSNKKAAWLLLGLLLACGGKSRPTAIQPPAPRLENAPPLWQQTDPSATAPPVSGDLSAEQAEPFARPPLIRVGLTTQAEAVRLSSSAPFRIRAGSQWITTHDVLIEKGIEFVAEGQIYRVQVASFLSRSRAQEHLTRLSEESGLSGSVARQPVTGRFAVCIGSWSTAGGARATVQGLTRLGYEGLRIVAEPSSSHRPSHLVLRLAGARTMRATSLSLVVLPGAPGDWLEVEGVPYRGYMEVFVNSSNRFSIVNIVNLEDYLKGVVPAELSPALFPQMEAIKAQAVAARTYAVRHLGQFAAEGFDLCATPACQVYGGVAIEQRMGSEAVLDTRGEVLTYDGEPIDALYTSTCGGHTEDVQNVFDGPALPYLVSRACYSELPPVQLSSSGALGLSWEAAGAVVVGLATEAELAKGSLGASITVSEASRWAERALARLGQVPCGAFPKGNQPVTAPLLAKAMADVLCWERRLPFLLPTRDVERLVSASEAPELAESERRALAYWIREQWIIPPPAGINSRRALTSIEVLESLYRRIASRGEPPLQEATIMGVGEDQLLVVRDDSEETIGLAPRRYLFRKVTDSIYYSPALSVLPDDRALIHHGDEGVDLIILLSSGTDYDRSSHFSRWTVRKSVSELTEEINEREALGGIVDLKPKRYGRSGRVVELEVVGQERSVSLRGLAIRRWLGIRENFFFIDRQLAPDGSVLAWVFTGGGWGHGVGLCQVGAYGMASAGHGYVEILKHYYTGATIAPWAEIYGEDR